MKQRRSKINIVGFRGESAVLRAHRIGKHDNPLESTEDALSALEKTLTALTRASDIANQAMIVAGEFRKKKKVKAYNFNPRRDRRESGSRFHN